MYFLSAVVFYFQLDSVVLCVSVNSGFLFSVGLGSFVCLQCLQWFSVFSWTR